MNSKKLILMLMLVFIIPNVLAIGITPARTTLNFEPKLHKEISFSIINTEKKDMSVVLFVRGDLNESVTLRKTYEEFSSSDGSKSFSYAVDLPAGFAKPGKYEAEIVALEMPKDIKEQGAFVGATLAVATQLEVYVPYPNKYAETEINVIGNVKGGKTRFLVPVTNRGKLDIARAKSTIDIYTSMNEKIATIETNEDSVKSLERKELYTDWNASVNPGEYRAVATTTYDGETATAEKTFEIGDMVLNIERIVVNNFQLGEIAKFEILVDNQWGDDIKEAYVQMQVYNSQGEVMADFKSPTYDISALSKKEIDAYWDTAGVKEGVYDGTLILKYSSKSEDKSIQVKITPDSLEVFGVTGNAVMKEKGKFNFQNLLIIAVIVLIIANIAWFVVVKRAIRGKNK